MQSSAANQIPLPVIAPRPLPLGDQMGSNPMAGMAGRGVSGDPYLPCGFAYESQPYPHNDLSPHVQRSFPPREASRDINQDPYGHERNILGFVGSASHPPYPNQGTSGSDSGIDMNQPGLSSDWSQSSASSNAPSAAYAGHGRYGASPTFSSISAASKADPASQIIYINHPPESGPDHWTTPVPNGYHDQWQPAIIPPQQDEGTMNTINRRIQEPVREGMGMFSISSPLEFEKFVPPGTGNMTIRPENAGTNELALDHKPVDQYMYPFPVHSFSTVEDREDDYWDVDSDDENLATHAMATASSSDLGLMLALSASQSDRGIRSLHSFLNEPNVLSTYHPVFTASPLMDPQTARVFCHFVTATAPTLSLCERRPANPSIMFSGAPVPDSQRSLWTYTLPMLALSNQGLLHAMLALASLHIAKLQQTSPTPSLKHYHFALRRVAKALGQPAKRQDVSTLAATLLLGFYEVTTAEHNKWNSHLAGARQLVTGIDFVGMNQRIKAHKARVKMNRSHQQYYDGSISHGHAYNALPPSQDAMDDEDAVDENLVSTIMGWKTSYNHYGRVLETESRSANQKPLTPKEIENFEIECDLFWWYCKQDTYQSMVSGNRLL